MEGDKVLFVSQEITPYLPESEISLVARNLPQGIQERGKEIRTFMPKYGCINERRNQLHEVIRLSGMNIIIYDSDHPLLIKVASIQAARMQVYFIDNEDYFQRKFILSDDSGNFFNDNDERAIFFARGVIETIKKLQWSPDIIHCHGWFTNLLPLYIKKLYHDEPLFSESKIIVSLYNNEYNKPLNGAFKDKLLMEGFSKTDISHITEPSFVNLCKLTIDNSDGIIIGSEKINNDVSSYIKLKKIPFLEYQSDDKYIDTYNNFYDNFLIK